MADFTFNIAKGKVARYADLPATNDALKLVLFKAAGLDADALLLDMDTLQVIKNTNDEADFTGYARRTLASVLSTPDDTNEYMTVTATNPAAYTNSGGASQAVGKAIVVYDPDTVAAADTAMVPLLAYDCVVTFDIGVATTLAFNVSGLYRAS